MSLQGVLSDDPIWNLLLVLLLFAMIVGGLYRWISRIRERQVSMLNSMLNAQFSVSTAELSETLDRRKLDRSTVISLVRRAENAVLSFGGTRVLSRSIMFDRVKDLLIENAIVHVNKLAIQWDLDENIIGAIVDEISNREGLDVVLTTDGDYILVPDFKARMKDNLDLHGRLDINNEAQRMRVSKIDLKRLIESWNWNLVESTEGFLLSLDWLRGVLERSVERDGFLDPTILSQRFGLVTKDILDGIKTFRWHVVSTTDGRMIPLHLLSELLKQRLESDGALDIKMESERIKVNVEDLERIMKGFGANYIITSDGSVLALAYLRERLLDDIALLGVILPQDSAKSFGVGSSLIQTVLEKERNIRKSKGGQYISISKFREWLFDTVKNEGTISSKLSESEWGIRSFELAAFLKSFGVRTIATRNNDFLSISWVRRWMLGNLSRGLEITPALVVERVNITEGEAEALISQLEADALMTSEGGLVPTAKVKEDIRYIFTEEGFFDIQTYSSEKRLDIADVETIADELELEALKTSDGRFLSKHAILKPLRWRLSSDGIYDLHTSARNLKLDYEVLATLVEEAITDSEYVVDEAGVVVTDKWIQEICEHAHSKGYVQVTAAARERGLRRGAFIALLRRYLKGAYISRSDSYVISSSS